MKVAIVSDKAANLRLLHMAIGGESDMQVLWETGDPGEATRKCARSTPDMILLDPLVSGSNGVSVARTIMSNTPCIILVVINGVDRHARLVFETMAAGALDAVDMPETTGAGLDHVVDKMRSLARLLKRKPRHSGSAAAGTASDVRSEFALAHDKPLLIAIGASTGGPAALKSILSDLPKGFAAAIVIAQHLDQEFAPMMASWLSQEAALPVAVARRGERPAAGRVLIAGTNEHMVLTEDGTLSYCSEPTELAYRPSVDEFFASAALYWDGPIVGVLLTGMGDDGARGLLALKRLGHYTIAQDEDSCVVYGMPKAAVKFGAVIQQLPLHKIGRTLVQLVTQLNSRAGENDHG